MERTLDIIMASLLIGVLSREFVTTPDHKVFTFLITTFGCMGVMLIIRELRDLNGILNEIHKLNKNAR